MVVQANEANIATAETPAKAMLLCALSWRLSWGCEQYERVRELP
jgi:hypothetical protein